MKSIRYVAFFFLKEKQLWCILSNVNIFPNRLMAIKNVNINKTTINKIFQIHCLYHRIRIHQHLAVAMHVQSHRKQQHPQPNSSHEILSQMKIHLPNKNIEIPSYVICFKNKNPSSLSCLILAGGLLISFDFLQWLLFYSFLFVFFFAFFSFLLFFSNIN